MTTFGDKIRKLRKEKKMTQQKLGDMVGVSHRTIRSWEVKDDIRSRVVYIKNWQMHFSVRFLIL